MAFPVKLLNLQNIKYLQNIKFGFGLHRKGHLYLPNSNEIVSGKKVKTWLEVAHWYWRGTGHWYHASTAICNGFILALLRSRLLPDTWSQDWGCTMPVPSQPSARCRHCPFFTTGAVLCRL